MAWHRAATVLAICVVIGLYVPASAATSTGNLNVSMTVTADCKVNAGGDSVLSFGSTGMWSMAINQQTAASGVGAIQVLCTNGTPYTIGLNAGANPSTPNDITTRRMKLDASNLINYQLYQDASRTTVWGNATGSWLSKTSDGTLQSWQVFGTVPVPGSPPAPGLYTDTVTITVTY